MADDPTLFGLHKLHLVKMSMANMCTCVSAHVCVCAWPCFCRCACVSPSESVCVCVYVHLGVLTACKRYLVVSMSLNRREWWSERGGQTGWSLSWHGCTLAHREGPTLMYGHSQSRPGKRSLLTHLFCSLHMAFQSFSILLLCWHKWVWPC